MAADRKMRICYLLMICFFFQITTTFAEGRRLSIVGIESVFSEEDFNTTSVFTRIGLTDKWALDLSANIGKDDSDESLKGFSLGANYRTNFGLNGSFSFGKQQDENNIDIRNFSLGLGYNREYFDLDFFQTSFSLRFSGDRYGQTLEDFSRPAPGSPLIPNETFAERQISLSVTQEFTEYFVLSFSYAFYSHSEDVIALEASNDPPLFPDIDILLNDFLDNTASISLDITPLTWFNLSLGMTQVEAIIDGNKTLILDVTPEIILNDNITLGVNYNLSIGDFSEKSEQFAISIEYIF